MSPYLIRALRSRALPRVSIRRFNTSPLLRSSSCDIKILDLKSKTSNASLQWGLESSISKLERDVRELKSQDPEFKISKLELDVQELKRVDPEIKIMKLESDVRELKSLSPKVLQLSNLERAVQGLKCDIKMNAKWVYFDVFLMMSALGISACILGWHLLVLIIEHINENQVSTTRLEEKIKKLREEYSTS